ncbi:MAG TPA: peptide chain release factor 1 [Candidatus Woesearchaeota archaeon]|nr:peptide chain release factor 1 [Candidatus Woesearchaeota archaeon]
MDEITYKLRKLVHHLSKMRGRHTELVTVYIPSGYNLNLIINHLSEEAGTAENIKSKSVRKNVVAALEKIISELRLYKKTPDNGLAIFCGNTSETEGRPDLQIWTIEPPEPINVRLYRCDQTFITGPLEDMLGAKNVYGLLVMDVKDANIALLKGKSIIPLNHVDSFVRGKMKAGGQSSVRFARERNEEIKQFFKKIGDMVVDAFEGKELNGIIVGGPGPTKDEFVNGPFMPVSLKKKILGVKDIGYTEEQGLRELVAKAEDLIGGEEIFEEKSLLAEFFGHLRKDDSLASYGEMEVRKNLEIGAVDRLLLSESLDEAKIDEFAEIANNFGTRVILISTETQEGVQMKELGGFGAILRYKI